MSDAEKDGFITKGGYVTRERERLISAIGRAAEEGTGSVGTSR